MTSKTFSLFGSECEFNLDTVDFVADPLMIDAYTYALQLQKIFNLYDDASELSVLNRQRNIRASPQLLEVVKYALELCNLSSGAYDISLGKNFLERKNDKPLSKLTCSYKDIYISGNDISITNDEAVIDLGSIAKGYIGDKIASFFMERGLESGFVDARGDLRVFGASRLIGIQHPRKDEVMLSVDIQNCGIATSGDYKQYFRGYDTSHIINQKNIISATVIAPNLTQADAYATLMMVSEIELREKLIKRVGFAAMTIDTDLNIQYYNNFERLVVR
jgi:thiamine biosynthesis lipoprotein